MKILLNFALFALLTTTSFSRSVNTRKQLRQDISRGHRPLGYKAARAVLFGKIYLQEDQQGSYIEDIYCKIHFREIDGVGPLKIPNHKKLNTEHAWPKTRFSKKLPFAVQKSDLFHLFPTANQANSFRGSLKFGEINYEGESIPGCHQAVRGKVWNSRVLAFSPPDDIKGLTAVPQKPTQIYTSTL